MASNTILSMRLPPPPPQILPSSASTIPPATRPTSRESGRPPSYQSVDLSRSSDHDADIPREPLLPPPAYASAPNAKATPSSTDFVAIVPRPLAAQDTLCGRNGLMSSPGATSKPPNSVLHFFLMLMLILAMYSPLGFYTDVVWSTKNTRCEHVVLYRLGKYAIGSSFSTLVVFMFSFIMAPTENKDKSSDQVEAKEAGRDHVIRVQRFSVCRAAVCLLVYLAAFLASAVVDLMPGTSECTKA